MPRRLMTVAAAAAHFELSLEDASALRAALQRGNLKSCYRDGRLMVDAAVALDWLEDRWIQVALQPTEV